MKDTKRVYLCVYNGRNKSNKNNGYISPIPLSPKGIYRALSGKTRCVEIHIKKEIEGEIINFPFV